MLPTRPNEISFLHNLHQIPKQQTHRSSSKLSQIPLITYKLLGLAGDIEHPLSLVDEILPDGLDRRS